MTFVKPLGVELLHLNSLEFVHSNSNAASLIKTAIGLNHACLYLVRFPGALFAR